MGINVKVAGRLIAIFVVFTNQPSFTVFQNTLMHVDLFLSGDEINSPCFPIRKE